MARYKSIISNFSGGLISSNLIGRTDIERTKSSATKMTNFNPDLQGPATYRQGWKYETTDYTPPSDSVSVNLLLATNKSYQVIFHDKKIDVVRSDGTVMTNPSIDSPYGVAILRELRFSSETDVLYITHPSYKPRKLFPALEYPLADLQDNAGSTLQSQEVDINGNPTANLTLQALVEVEGDDSWTLEEIEFEREPFLEQDESGDEITASNEERIVKLTSTVTTAFDSIANDTGNETDWYVEYQLENNWFLGRVVTSSINYSISAPTAGTGIVYVEPVEKIVDIEDPSARLFLVDNASETVSDAGDRETLRRYGVDNGKIVIRSDTTVFSSNQVGAWIRVGDDRRSNDVPLKRDRSRTRWQKITKHNGTKSQPVDFIFGQNTIEEKYYNSGDIYKFLRMDGVHIDVKHINTTGNVTDVTAIIPQNLSGVTGVFTMFTAFHINGHTTDRVPTSDDDPNIVANLSTQIEVDEVECDSTVPVVEEHTASNTSGRLVSPSGFITVETIADDVVLNSTGDATFKLTDIGRHFLGELSENYVYAKIKRFTTSSQVVAQLLTSFPKNPVTNTLENNGKFENFRLGAWYTNNYPKTVAKYEQRRVYGGTNKQPNFLFFSKTGQELDFSPAEANKQVLETSGISYPLSNINASIRWLKGGRNLLAGTTGGVFRLLPNQFAASVSPTSIRIELSDNEGCNDDGILVGSSVFFPDQSNSRLMEYLYDGSADSFTNDVSKLLYPTFVTDPIKKVDYQHTPQPRIWVLTQNNNLYCLTYYKAENFYAWSKVDTRGTVTDLCVMREGSETDLDQVWITRSDTGGFSHEVLDESKNVYLDKYQEIAVTGFTYNRSSTNVFSYTLSGDTYSVGDNLGVYFKGAFLGEFPVGSGPANTKVVNVNWNSYFSTAYNDPSTFSVPSGTIYVGYLYTGEITPMNPSYDISNGNVFGAEESRVVTNKVLVAQGFSYEIGVKDRFEERALTDNKFDSAEFSGFDKERPVVNAQYGESFIPTLRHKKPQPLTISALITKSDIHV